MKVNVVVPALPSFWVTLLTERLGQTLMVVALFRGGLLVFEVMVEKLLLLASVSVQPFCARTTESVLLGAGVAAVPSKQLAVVPKPTKSTMVAPVGQAPVNAVVVFTRATLPAAPAMAMLPVAFGVGSAVASVFAPAACCTR